MADAPLEDRVKRALSWFGARIGRKEVPVPVAADSMQAGALISVDRGRIRAGVLRQSLGLGARPRGHGCDPEPLPGEHLGEDHGPDRHAGVGEHPVGRRPAHEPRLREQEQRARE